jgi:hypothetical protein
MTPSRGFVAILVSDVASYSRLMGVDGAGTAKAVREHREAAQPRVTRRAGRRVKTMT